jgi:hypothetical protein
LQNYSSLKATTPNCMVYEELGRYPLDIDIKLRNMLPPLFITSYITLIAFSER